MYVQRDRLDVLYPSNNGNLPITSFCLSLKRYLSSFNYYATMVKSLSMIVALAAVLGVQSFSSSSLATSRSSATQADAYIPSGFTPESYKKFKEQEAKKAKKNLGGK
jgi:hypothetical protein